MSLPVLRRLLLSWSSGRMLNPSYARRYMGSGSASGSGSGSASGSRSGSASASSSGSGSYKDGGTKFAAGFRKFVKSDDFTTSLIVLAFAAYAYNVYEKDVFRGRVMEKVKGIRDAVDGASAAPKDPRNCS